MIESMKIRKGLVFTLPIEPDKVIGMEGNKLRGYIYDIEGTKYALANMYPLTLKVAKIDKAIVECNIIADNTIFHSIRIFLYNLKRLQKMVL